MCSVFGRTQLRLGWFTPGLFSCLDMRLLCVHFIFFSFSLTADKKLGETIEIDGKKVALGIPASATPPEPSSLFSTIPLGRGATADEAAGSMLLYVPSLL